MKNIKINHYITILLMILLAICFNSCKQNSNKTVTTNSREINDNEDTQDSPLVTGEVFDLSKLANHWTTLSKEGDKRFLHISCEGFKGDEYFIEKQEDVWKLKIADGFSIDEANIKSAELVNNDLVLTLVADWNIDKDFQLKLLNYTEDKKIITWEVFNGKQVDCVKDSGKDSVETIHQDPHECGIYTKQETEDFNKLFQPLDIKPNELNKIHLIEGNKIPGLYLNKFPYQFKMLRESDIFALYRFDFNERMNALIVRADDEDKGMPTIKLLFEYKNGNDEELDGFDISNNAFDISIIATRDVFESDYIIDINKDGQLDLVWRNVKFKGFDSSGKEDFDISTKVFLANKEKLTFNKSFKANPALFTDATEYITSKPIFTKHNIKLYKDALLVNDKLFYSSNRDSLRAKLIDQTKDCPAFCNSEYKPLSLVGDYFSYEKNEFSQGACGVPGFSHTVQAISLTTFKKVNILDLVEEASLVAALKKDSYVVKNANIEKLNNANTFNDILKSYNGFSFNESSFAILKYDEQVNKIHIRLMKAYDTTPSENHLQLGLVVTPKDIFKKELKKSDNFYLRTFKSTYK